MVLVEKGEIKGYQNRKNKNKYIEIKHCKDGHYMWRQFMSFPNRVVNHVGTAKGGFRRIHLSTSEEVIDSDYFELS